MNVTFLPDSIRVRAFLYGSRRGTSYALCTSEWRTRRVRVLMCCRGGRACPSARAVGARAVGGRGRHTAHNIGCERRLHAEHCHTVKVRDECAHLRRAARGQRCTQQAHLGERVVGCAVGSAVEGVRVGDAFGLGVVGATVGSPLATVGACVGDSVGANVVGSSVVGRRDDGAAVLGVRVLGIAVLQAHVDQP